MVRIDVKLPIDYTEADLRKACGEVLRREIGEDIPLRLLRRGIVAESPGNMYYRAAVGLTFDSETERKLLKRKKLASPVPSFDLILPKKRLASRPVVVGSGPAGLFAALILAEAGARPIVLERGQTVERRRAAVDFFHRTGILDEESNIQFGEGGAGTFSDGKLKVGSLNPYNIKVLSEFVAAGAPASILCDTAAHIGTDLLCTVITNLRRKLESLGAEIRFGAKVTDLLSADGRITGVRCLQDGEMREIATDTVILATGHSARDVFRMLRDRGIPMEAHPFGIGMRIEHPRRLIDRARYGENPPKALGAASYHLVTHLESGRSVYSFCMCPGGSVVAAASEQDAVVTNGMSLHARNGENSNAALLVSVSPADFGSDDPLAGIEFARRWEKAAFSVAGDTRAPAVRLDDFLCGKVTKEIADVAPTYPRGVVFADPGEFLPGFAVESLKLAIPEFDRYLPGFAYPGAVLTGVETRSTSPVRVLRTERGDSPLLSGLFPCGEGAGYAGGIVSSAVDGIMAAEKVLSVGQI